MMTRNTRKRINISGNVVDVWREIGTQQRLLSDNQIAMFLVEQYQGKLADVSDARCALCRTSLVLFCTKCMLPVKPAPPLKDKTDCTRTVPSSRTVSSPATDSEEEESSAVFLTTEEAGEQAVLPEISSVFLDTEEAGKQAVLSETSSAFLDTEKAGEQAVAPETSLVFQDTEKAGEQAVLSETSSVSLNTEKADEQAVLPENEPWIASIESKDLKGDEEPRESSKTSPDKVDHTYSTTRKPETVDTNDSIKPSDAQNHPSVTEAHLITKKKDTETVSDCGPVKRKRTPRSVRTKVVKRQSLPSFCKAEITEAVVDFPEQSPDCHQPEDSHRRKTNAESDVDSSVPKVNNQLTSCERLRRRTNNYNSNRRRREKRVKMAAEQAGAARPFVCDVCGESYSLYLWLKRHQKEVHQVIHTDSMKPFTCKTCGLGFEQTSALKKHLYEHTGVKPHVCKFCNASFLRAGSLNRHIRIHTGEKPYLCGICGLTFTVSGSLVRHLRLHSGEKPYICSQCGFRSNTASDLASHEKLHTHPKEEVISCKECGLSFDTIPSLKDHMHCHMGEKPFVCEVCCRAFKRNDQLKRHFLMHTGEKPYVCNECGMSHRTLESAKLHLQKKHAALNSYFAKQD